MSLPPSSYGPPPDPPQPHYGYPPTYGAPSPASRTLAGWSLGLAIFPSCITWVISIVFACMVISRSKDGRDHGKKMSIAALIIIGVWVLIVVAVIVVLAATDADRDDSGRVTDGGRENVTDLRVGDCIADDLAKGRVFSVNLVTCSQPHLTEVYAVFDLDGEFTTADDVKESADAGCYERFKDYIGIGSGKTSLHVLDLVPLDAAGFRADPGVTCLVTADEPVTGSLKGSKR